MSIVLLTVWDGFHIIAEGLGLAGRAANRFADIVWVAFALMTGLWLASVVLVLIQ